MTVITLPKRCDRAAAEAMVADFRSAQDSGPLEIDANSVTQIGIAMLQILVSARRSCGAVITPSPALIDAAQITGLSAALFDENIP